MTTPAPAGQLKTQAGLLGFIAVCLFVYVCEIAEDIMIPFVVALFVWYLINAIAKFLGHLHTQKGKTMPRSVRFLLAILMLVGMGFVVYELVHQNISAVMTEAPKFQASFERIVTQAAVFLRLDHIPTMQEIIGEVTHRYLDIGGAISAFALMLTGLTGKAVIVLLFVGFLLFEQRFFMHKIKWIFKDRESEAHMHSVLKAIDTRVQKYIGVKSLVSFIDSSLTFGILTFFNVDFAAFWGVMAFFLHFIPYAGSFIAITMPVMIALIQFGDLQSAALVLAALSISHAFLGHILDPYLMGNNLNLSPIFIISNLAMWGMIWGVPGMFLAIPILAIVTITLAQFPATKPIAVLISKTGVIEE